MTDLHLSTCAARYSTRALCECGASRLGDPSGDQPSDCAVDNQSDHMGRIFDSRPVYMPPGFSPYGPYENDGRPATRGETIAILAGIMLSLVIFMTAVVVVGWSIWP